MKKGQSSWHEPFHYAKRPRFQQRVCVLREPMERLMSEYNMHARPPDQCNAEHLHQWVHNSLIAKRRRNMYTDDCHFLHYTAYAPSCDYIVPYTKGLTAFTTLLRHRFRIDGLGLDSSAGQSNFARSQCRMSVRNMSTADLALVRTVYHRDMILYRKAEHDFQYLATMHVRGRAGRKASDAEASQAVSNPGAKAKPKILDDPELNNVPPDWCPDKKQCAVGKQQCLFGCDVPWHMSQFQKELELGTCNRLECALGLRFKRLGCKGIHECRNL